MRITKRLAILAAVAMGMAAVVIPSITQVAFAGLEEN
jgi:hypothetical protein